MAHQSKSKTILTTALEIAAANHGQASVDAISRALNNQTRLQHKRLINTLSELHLAGRLRRIDTGLYGPPDVPRPPDRRERMWRILKMRRRVQCDDLVEMAEVSRDYANEWLCMLVKQGVAVKHQQGKAKATWQLVNDPGETPVDTAKAARLRALRKQKKERLLAGCNAIQQGLAQIIEALQTGAEE